MAAHPPVRFSVIGMNHDHIQNQVKLMLRAGAELVSCFAAEPEILAAFSKSYPQARPARSVQEILEDPTVQLVVSAGIPCERAPLGIQVMQHGKDYMVDKPGATSLRQLEQVRRVQKETKRIYSICYSERFENPATVAAGELARAGAIGRVVQTVGLGPHRTRLPNRPDWFFVREKYGGILCDIASHQFDQFLYFTGSTSAKVLASQVGNFKHPQYPELEDFGDVMLQGNNGSGFIRVDWYTPNGLEVWGDTRLFVLGSEGYIEVRKNIDITGKPGASHCFLVDQKGTHYFDCKDGDLPYGRLLVDDINNRTETAMTHEHCFLATELALRAQAQAIRLGNLQ